MTHWDFVLFEILNFFCFILPFELTRCPVDSTVMQSFKIMHNVGTESKVYYTTFPAFKFPGSQYLNIQCTLLVCRQICPTVSLKI